MAAFQPLDLGPLLPDTLPAGVCRNSLGPGRPVTFAEAVVLAEAAANDGPVERRYPLGVLAVREESFGWVMSLQSRRFIETGNDDDVLIGVGLTIVDRETGAVYSGGSGAWGWSTILGFLMATGRTTPFPVERYRSLWVRRGWSRPQDPADETLGAAWPWSALSAMLRRLGSIAEAVWRAGRTLAGIAVAWAAAWSLPGLIAGVPQWIVVGFVAGGGFSLVLAVRERHRAGDNISLIRAALWGALASAHSAMLIGPVLLRLDDGGVALVPFAVMTAILGGASAAATVAIASS
jgi:hypothetical protein